MSDRNINRLLSNRYQLQGLIGAGAMGRVYLAKDVLLGGVPVAIKFLTLSTQNQTMRLKERFEREAKTCALLGQRSIHIVRVMDYGVDEYNTPFYVMEYLPGSNLGSIIRKHPLSLPRFLSMARQICLGLQYAHEGIPLDDKVYPIIHRDIKPSNIIVIADPSFGELVKILDFGIAKLVQPDGNHTNFYLGTLAYSSPEQMEGKELDNRSDIYSLGVMMFEMLIGKLPLVAPAQSFGAWYKVHHNQEPRSFKEADPRFEVPKDLEDLVRSCLAKNPNTRPSSISEILNVLSSLEQQHQCYNNFIPNEEPELQQKSKSNLPLCVSSDEVARDCSWPENKPIADIVFPSAIRTNKQLSVALWVMLPQQEIDKRLICTRYNQFLFVTDPHPALLWITLFYNSKYGDKWFPYYLDLKTSYGQEIISSLQQTGYYRVLLFAREAPNHCAHVAVLTIAFAQRQRLQQWLTLSNTSVSYANFQASKNLLKTEYEKLKPKIVAKLHAMNTDSSFNVCG